MKVFFVKDKTSNMYYVCGAGYWSSSLSTEFTTKENAVECSNVLRPLFPWRKIVVVSRSRKEK